jgi:hypothetical protein
MQKVCHRQRHPDPARPSPGGDDTLIARLKYLLTYLQVDYSLVSNVIATENTSYFSSAVLGARHNRLLYLLEKIRFPGLCVRVCRRSDS